MYFSNELFRIEREERSETFDVYPSRKGCIELLTLCNEYRDVIKFHISVGKMFEKLTPFFCADSEDLSPLVLTIGDLKEFSKWGIQYVIDNRANYRVSFEIMDAFSWACDTMLEELTYQLDTLQGHIHAIETAYGDIFHDEEGAGNARD